MSQTSGYGFTMDKGQTGNIFDLRDNTIESFAAEEAIAPGKPLMRGTDPEKQAVISDATDFLGIAVFSHTLAEKTAYAIGDTVPVMTKGAVLVDCAVADAVAGEVAYVTAAGAITNVSTDALAIGKFITSSTGVGSLVAIEI